MHQVVVLLVARAVAQIPVAEVELVVEIDHRVRAAARDRRLAPARGVRVAAITQQRVPDRLEAVLGHPEGNAARRAGDAIAAGHELRDSGIGRRFFVHRLGKSGAAPRRIDIHLQRRILLQQCNLAGGQLRAISVEIAGADGEHRHIRLVGIGIRAAGSMTRERSLEAALPCWNGPCGVAGRFCSERGPVLCARRNRDGERDHERDPASTCSTHRTSPQSGRVAFRTHSSHSPIRSHGRGADSIRWNNSRFGPAAAGPTMHRARRCRSRSCRRSRTYRQSAPATV